MIQLPRSNWMLALLLALAAILGAAALRAAAQSVMTGPPAQQPSAAAVPAGAPTAPGLPGRAAINPPSAEAPSDRAPTPATQPRDVTPPTAPGSDIRGSADNNVSFPVDI